MVENGVPIFDTSDVARTRIATLITGAIQIETIVVEDAVDVGAVLIFAVVFVVFVVGRDGLRKLCVVVAFVGHFLFVIDVRILSGFCSLRLYFYD